MTLIDKLLLVALIGILPLGLIFVFFKSDLEILTASEPEPQVDIAQVESLIDQLTQTPTPTPKPKFSIGKAAVASKSATLEIDGVAPESNSTVLVTATVLPAMDNSTSQTVKGTRVELISVLPTKDKHFNLELPLRRDELKSVIELRFQQQDTVTTIMIDMETGKQL